MITRRAGTPRPAYPTEEKIMYEMERANQGMALIERVWPHWVADIRPAKLDMSNGQLCVLGQIARVHGLGQWGYDEGLGLLMAALQDEWLPELWMDRSAAADRGRGALSYLEAWAEAYGFYESDFCESGDTAYIAIEDSSEEYRLLTVAWRQLFERRLAGV